MSQRKNQLKLLINKYKTFRNEGRLDSTSEETMRSWINELLAIFDWDVKDTSQILQEKVLSKEEKSKLKEINSTFTRPDYGFKLGKKKLTFLDAKSLDINIEKHQSSAFQIKSYGWSISASFAFLTNFEEFAIYDTSYIPNQNQPVTNGRIYFKLDEYIDNFEILEKHLLKENMIAQLSYNREKSNTMIDTLFAEQLSKFRLSLANNILLRNNVLIANNIELLGYLTQVIINRVIFIRICEARQVEREGLLLNFFEEGFWSSFKNSSYNDFYEHYDGPLFDRIELLHSINIDDNIFKELLDLLYYPSPYRFDVIPAKLLNDIYEIFLAKKLLLKDNSIVEQLKPEYLKSNGAVSTPQYLVNDLIKRTIVIEDDIDIILNQKILDFACGSGIFLIEAFDYLEYKLIESYKKYPDSQYKQFFFNNGKETILTIEGKREIISRCIYGIDIDAEAVEVAKMSLSLKVIDEIEFFENYQELGFFTTQILNSVGNNIYCGNTLVSSDIFEKYPSIIEIQKDLLKINPFDFEDSFDFIIGNPPYVEVKHYKEESPLMHQYIKEQFETTSNGKIDLSVAFIEKGISLLNPIGKMGLIVQKRFFKTDYGKGIRKYISENNLLSQLIDFQSTSIFPKRITYISSLVLDKSKPKNIAFYKLVEDEVEARLEKLPIFEEDNTVFNILPSSSLSEKPWNFDNPQLLTINNQLLEKFGIFGEFASVKVGIQVLWDKAYHIEVHSINSDGTLTGDTKLEKNITIEIDACRPLMVNKKFYPFCEDKTDIYVIFPYTVEIDKNNPINWETFEQDYPRTSAYLKRQRSQIIENVKTKEEWHLFTRVQNHLAVYPKILLPMTALDTFATVTKNPLNYCDNANMFFIEIPEKSDKNLYALSAVINSILFSVLARLIANPQQNGYFKFNKQFIEPIPFPKNSFETNKVLVSKLAKLSQDIESNQKKYKNSTPRQKNIFKKLLNRLWLELDNSIFELYELNQDDRDFFLENGRNIDRVELLDA